MSAGAWLPRGDRASRSRWLPPARGQPRKGREPLGNLLPDLPPCAGGPFGPGSTSWFPPGLRRGRQRRRRGPRLGSRAPHGRARGRGFRSRRRPGPERAWPASEPRRQLLVGPCRRSRRSRSADHVVPGKLCPCAVRDGCGGQGPGPWAGTRISGPGALRERGPGSWRSLRHGPRPRADASLCDPGVSVSCPHGRARAACSWGRAPGLRGPTGGRCLQLRDKLRSQGEPSAPQAGRVRGRGLSACLWPRPRPSPRQPTAGQGPGSLLGSVHRAPPGSWLVPAAR